MVDIGLVLGSVFCVDLLVLVKGPLFHRVGISNSILGRLPANGLPGYTFLVLTYCSSLRYIVFLLKSFNILVYVEITRCASFNREIEDTFHMLLIYQPSQWCRPQLI